MDETSHSQETQDAVPPVSMTSENPQIEMPEDHDMKHYLIVGVALVILILIGGYIGNQVLNSKPSDELVQPTPMPTTAAEPTPALINAYTHETENYTFSYPDGTNIEKTGTELRREEITINNTIQIYYQDKVWDSCDTPGDCPYWDAVRSEKQLGEHSVIVVEHTSGGLGYTTLKLRSYYVPVPDQETYLVFDTYAANLDIAQQSDPDSSTVGKYDTIPEGTIQLVEGIIASLKFATESSNNDFADWEEVYNPTFNYSIKYPADRYVNCYSTNGELRLYKKEEPCPSVGDAFFAIGVLTVVKSAPSYSTEHSTPDKVTDITIDGKPAQEKYYEYDWRDGQLQSIGTSTEIHIPTDNGRIEVKMLGSDPEVEKDFRDMVSTMVLFDE